MALIGFNRAQVDKFFKVDLYDKYNFRPNRIYNMDETGMSTVPNKLCRLKAKNCE